MSLRERYCEVTERLGLADPWWLDVERDYGVGRREALGLGARAPGRRPTLPGSKTCQPVSGMSWEEIWQAKPRRTEAEIEAFWRDVGSWCVFRQLVRHRGRGFPAIRRVLRPGGVLLEWGCGIAPVSWWLQRRGVRFQPLLIDLPSEPLAFAKRRVRVETPLRPPRHALDAIVDVAVVLEVLEHVTSPLEAMVSILFALRHGGYLFEDYYRHDGAGSPADLESAAKARPAVYELIREHCELITGQAPEAPEGGGRRCWRKR